MPGVVVSVAVLSALLDVADHVGAQPVPQLGSFLVVHHHEVEFDLLHARHGTGSPVDVLGELVGAGPGGNRQRHLNLHPVASRPDRSHQSEVTERQTDLGIAHSAHCGLQL